MEKKSVGCATRVRVELPLGARRGAWDCRRFGLGRIVTPVLPMQIELVPGMHLDLCNGELFKEERRHLAA
jgi:hypothetical protein